MYDYLILPSSPFKTISAADNIIATNKFKMRKVKKNSKNIIYIVPKCEPQLFKPFYKLK